MAGAVSSRTIKGIGGSVPSAPAFGRPDQQAVVEPIAAVAPTAADLGGAQAAICSWKTIWAERIAGGSDVEPVAEAVGHGGTETPVSARAGGFRPGITTGSSEQ